MKLDRTRIIFIAIIGLAALVICGVAAYSIIGNITDNDQTDVVDNSNNDNSNTNGSTVTNVNLESPDPIWGPNYDASDGLPTYVCGADAFGSYFTLQQMQMSGKDIAHGFHLGIIPFFLTDDYDITEEQRTALLDSGQWNCLLTTLDSVALSSPGVITAIVDESAGADQLWGRDIDTINDLAGKRIAFARDSVGE